MGLPAPSFYNWWLDDRLLELDLWTLTVKSMPVLSTADLRDKVPGLRAHMSHYESAIVALELFHDVTCTRPTMEELIRETSIKPIEGVDDVAACDRFIFEALVRDPRFG